MATAAERCGIIIFTIVMTIQAAAVREGLRGRGNPLKPDSVSSRTWRAHALLTADILDVFVKTSPQASNARAIPTYKRIIILIHLPRTCDRVCVGERGPRVRRTDFLVRNNIVCIALLRLTDCFRRRRGANLIDRYRFHFHRGTVEASNHV